MDHIIMAIHEFSKRIESVEERLARMEVAASRDRSNLKNIQGQLTSVARSMEKAMDQIMPKLDALLSRQDGVTALPISVPSASEAVTNAFGTSVANSSAAAATDAAAAAVATAAAAAVATAATAAADKAVAAASTKALLPAAKRGDAEEILRLLQAGADVKVRNSGGDTALHLAANAGHEDVVTALLGAGAEVDASGWGSRTPLHLAVIGGHLGVARRLLLAGALTSARDDQGSTALIHAVSDPGPHWDVVKLLLRHGAGADPAKTTVTVRRAALEGQADVVREILRCSSLPEGRDLWRLLSFSSSAAVVWAFDDAVPGCARGRPGENALMHAASQGRAAAVAALLDAGVDVDARAANGSALSYASHAGRSDCVRLLLGRGADTDVRDRNGFTPLHNAARQGNDLCVFLLLNAGANKRIKNIAGQTPFDVAKTNAVRHAFWNH